MPNACNASMDIRTSEDHPRRSARIRRWRLRTCCLKASLQTGCTIISAWSMTEALLFMFGASSLLYKSNIPKCKDINEGSKPRIPCLLPEHSEYFMTAVVFVLLIMSVYFLVSALMLFGIYKKRPRLLRPWLWWNIGEMIVTFHTFTILERSLSIFIKIYFCLVVYSYIEELKERASQENIITYVSLQNGGHNATLATDVSAFPTMSDGEAPPTGVFRPGFSREERVGSPYVYASHCMPPNLTPEDIAEKFDVRMYSERPPPYSPPREGDGATVGLNFLPPALQQRRDVLAAATSDGGPRNETSSSGAAEGGLDGTETTISIARSDVNATTSTTSDREGNSTDQPLATASSSALVKPSNGGYANTGACNGSASYTAVMPPPSYEESIKDEVVAYLPQFTSSYQHAGRSADTPLHRTAEQQPQRQSAAGIGAEQQQLSTGGGTDAEQQQSTGSTSAQQPLEEQCMGGTSTEQQRSTGGACVSKQTSSQ